MGYPASAYRGGQRAAGSQSSGYGYGYNGPPPKPANDNRVPMPHPANDNAPGRPRPRPRPGRAKFNMYRMLALRAMGPQFALTIGAELLNYQLDRARLMYPDTGASWQPGQGGGWTKHLDCPSTPNMFYNVASGSCGVGASSWAVHKNKYKGGIYRDGFYWRYRGQVHRRDYQVNTTPPTPMVEWDYSKNWSKVDIPGTAKPPTPAWIPNYDPFANPAVQPLPEIVPGRVPAPAIVPLPLPAVHPPYVDVPKWNRQAAQASANRSARGNRSPRGAPTPRIRSRRDSTRKVRNEPPGRNVRERKLKLMNNGHPVMRVVNAVTEAADMMEAAHNALPCHMRARKGAPPDEQAKALWKNLDAVHIPTFIQNLILNQLEDMMYGALGQAQKGVNQAIGQSYGKQSHGLRVADRAMRRLMDDLPEDMQQDIKDAWDPIGDIYDTADETLEKLTNNIGLLKRMAACS